MSSEPVTARWEDVGRCCSRAPAAPVPAPSLWATWTSRLPLGWSSPRRQRSPAHRRAGTHPADAPAPRVIAAHGRHKYCSLHSLQGNGLYSSQQSWREPQSWVIPLHRCPPVTLLEWCPLKNAATFSNSTQNHSCVPLCTFTRNIGKTLLSTQ